MESFVNTLHSFISDKFNYHQNLDEYMKKLKRKSKELDSRKQDVISRKQSELQPGKKLKKEVELWLANVERTNREIQNIEIEVGEAGFFSRAGLGKRVTGLLEEVEELWQKGIFSDDLVVEVPASNQEMLPTAPLAGETTTKRKMEEIWAFLMSDDVRKIGVYGMGGAGKTTVMKHVYNLLLRRTDKFDKLIWVTVSKAFDIVRLQYDISRRLCINLSDYGDVTERASKIFATLRHMRRYVLILDDAWEAFQLETVGIPEPTIDNGCKLVLTTRSLEVCERMDCQGVKLELLSETEAWQLFLNKVGSDILLTPNIEATARQVAKECACLPLAINTVAGSLKGIVDPSEWCNALEELMKSRNKHNDMGNQVLQKLKLSYSRLKDEKLQECLLYCALYPEDFAICREELVELLIAEGIIEACDSRQAELNKGNAMLNKLEKACLLQGSIDFDGNRFVKMHDLIRDMALEIMGVHHRVMVGAGMQLREIPGQEKWTKYLEKVSLMENYITEIPSSRSPPCHNLSTLLLCANRQLETISGSFFEQLHELRVLNLSFTVVEKLPDSISDLVNLNALLLRGCQQLTHVPSLAKLRELKRLDLSFTGLQEVPQGMEMLSDMRYLNLNAPDIGKLPLGLLPKLHHLQFLVLYWMSRTLSVKGEEIACLRKLETLECQFCDLHGFNLFLRSLGEYHLPPVPDFHIERQRQLCKYRLRVGPGNGFREDEEFSKEVSLEDFSISKGGEDPLVLPKGIQKLEIIRCHNVRSLHDISSLANASELRSFSISDCDGIEYLLLFFSLCYCFMFQGLETIGLYRLKNLHVLFKGEGAATAMPLPLSAYSTFSRLKIIKIYSCPNIKNMFPLGLLSQLQNLEEIFVQDCEKMEEIIATVTTEEEYKENCVEGIVGKVSSNISIDNYATSIKFFLPRLRHFSLINLPELKSICSGTMVWYSLETIWISNCPKLKRIPLSLMSLLGNGQLSPPPCLIMIYIYQKDWWESLEWDHPDAKSVLQPFCRFDEKGNW